MIILDAPQGSTEWLTARLYRLTASRMKYVITPTGGLSKAEKTFAEIDKLIAGQKLALHIAKNPTLLDDANDWEMKKIFAEFNGDNFTGNHLTERGKLLESDAVASLADRIGSQIDDVGMVLMGDSPLGVVSASPDGLIFHPEDGNLISGAEVKCPALHTFYGWIADRELPPEHKMQCHAGMAVCGVDTWHFAAYFPAHPLFYVEVQRDAYTDKIAQSLNDFSAIYRDRFDEIQEAIHCLKINQEAAA